MASIFRAQQERDQQAKQIQDLLGLNQFIQQSGANQQSLAQNQSMQLLGQQGLLPQGLGGTSVGPAPAPFVPQTVGGAEGLLEFNQQQSDPFRQAQIESLQAGTALTRAQTGIAGQATPLSAEDKALKTAQVAQINAEIKTENAKIGLLSVPERREAALIKAGIKESFVAQRDIDKTNSEILKNQAAAAASLASANPDKKLTTNEKISQANSWRKEFNARNTDFTKINDAFEKMKAVSVEPSAAGDIALIFNYMKILDPGSTVREGEFATAENAGSVPNAIKNMWNKAVTGERVTFNRPDFLKQAQNMFATQQKSLERKQKQYTTLAKKHGVDPEDVIGQPQEQDISQMTDAELDALIGAQ